jgi:hypothetical protein
MLETALLGNSECMVIRDDDLKVVRHPCFHLWCEGALADQLHCGINKTRRRGRS